MEGNYVVRLRGTSSEFRQGETYYRASGNRMDSDVVFFKGVPSEGDPALNEVVGRSRDRWRQGIDITSCEHRCSSGSSERGSVQTKSWGGPKFGLNTGLVRLARWGTRFGSKPYSKGREGSEVDHHTRQLVSSAARGRSRGTTTRYIYDNSFQALQGVRLDGGLSSCRFLARAGVVRLTSRCRLRGLLSIGFGA